MSRVNGNGTRRRRASQRRRGGRPFCSRNGTGKMGGKRGRDNEEGNLSTVLELRHFREHKN